MFLESSSSFMASSCLQASMASLLPCSSSAFSSSSNSFRRRNLKRFGFHFASFGARASAKIPMPPINPKDPFLSILASVAEKYPERILNRPVNSDTPPYLDLFESPMLMSSPAQVERSVSYGGRKHRSPPPDLPSMLLDGRIIYIGMPLVPAVTELVIAELMYLQWSDSKEPIYLYINSTGTTRDDGETVGMETEGFAIYDSLMSINNEIHTVCVGAAIGQACLLLSAGTKGKRCMMPHSKAMIQQPRAPSSGLMPASDVLIRAKEVMTNRDVLVELLAKHTGNAVETVANVMRRPYYMDAQKAKEFGVIDKILEDGENKIISDKNAKLIPQRP